MSSGGARNACQARDGPFGVLPCVAGPGDVGIGTHSARGRHSTCAMAPKPMEYEITDGRRGDETLAQQSPRESSRVRGGLLTVILGTNLPMTPARSAASSRRGARDACSWGACLLAFTRALSRPTSTVQVPRAGALRTSLRIRSRTQPYALTRQGRRVILRRC